jgi:hypothetical protein
VKEKIYDFLTTHHLRQVLDKTADLLDRGDYDQIVREVTRARQVASEDAPPLEFFKDYDLRIMERKLRDKRGITTGFARLDYLTSGGLPKCNSGLIIAPTGRGKTAILGRIATAATVVGFDVLFVTLELDPFVIGDRLDASICNINISHLKLQEEKVRSRLETWMKMKKKTLGRLYIQEFPAGKLSVTDLDAYLDKIYAEEGFKPDLVIVDYVDRMQWAASRDIPFWKALEHLMDDLRNLAKARRFAFWTATQAVRSAAGKEEIENEDSGGSYAKTFSPDLVIAASRTKEEERLGLMRLFVSKSRLGGEKTNVFLKPNFERMRFEEMTKEQYEGARGSKKKRGACVKRGSAADEDDLTSAWGSTVGDV